MKRAATESRKVHTFRSADYLERLMAELDRAAICARIGQAREEAGLTQAELADTLRVHWRTVQTWESVKDPRVPWGRLDEIARLTGRSRDWLLHGVTSADGEQEGAAVAELVLAEIRDLRSRLEEAGVLPRSQDPVADDATP